MPAKSSVVSLSAYLVFLTHFLILFSVTNIMPKKISFFDSLQGILLLVISWAPLFLIVCVFLFYGIFNNPSDTNIFCKTMTSFSILFPSSFSTQGVLFVFESDTCV
jgi:hypothetical protein